MADEPENLTLKLDPGRASGCARRHEGSRAGNMPWLRFRQSRRGRDGQSEDARISLPKFSARHSAVLEHHSQWRETVHDVQKNQAAA